MNKKIRVLMIGKYFFPSHGGMEQYMLDHFQTLKDEVDFTLLVFNKEKRCVIENFEGAKLIRVPVTISLGNVPLGFQMWKYMFGYHGDVILIHAPNPIPMLGLLFLRLKNKKVIVMHHYDIEKQKILLFFYRPFLLLALQKADIIVATARNNIKYSSILKRFIDKCKVISLGVNPDQFTPSDKTLAKARAIKQTYPGRRVLFIGRLTYYKGLKYLIAASKDCSYNLFIIGTGNEGKSLRRQAADNHNIHFLGRIEDLLPYYYASDLFVLPSVAKSEAFGIVQLEAMACGLPVITTNLPSGVPEVQVHGETGYIVEPKDTRALRAKIDHLLQNDEIRLNMGRAAKVRVRKHFALEMTKQQWLQLYSE